MKINKKNPQHLKALLISAIYSIFASATRLSARGTESPKKIIFYGHTLNGNLKAFYDFLLDQPGYKPYFLVLDTDYYARLVKKANHPETILNALKMKDMMVVARSNVFITSHGLHLFSILRLLTNIKFVDVWHAVSYKGFDKKDFKHLHPHDEIWVSSEYISKMYKGRFGFRADKVKITGYGRTDKLVDGSLNKKEIISKYRIPRASKYVLIAPTWKQDSSGRSVLPFGMSEDEFFHGIDEIAGKNSAHVIFRTHLNSNDEISVDHLSNISFMPYSKYEVVEDFLYISDILVTDWSSIGIDYLPLRRPAIFLDVPAPFKKGFELGPEHRYGDVVDSLEGLKYSLEKYLKDPDQFIKKHNKHMEKTTKVAYGNSLDGKSVMRYFDNLKRLAGD